MLYLGQLKVYLKRLDTHKTKNDIKLYKHKEQNVRKVK